MQVYLPNDLYLEVKQRGLVASELLQEAVRVEVRRRELIGAGDDYLVDLIAEVGAPSPEETARAREIARRLARRARHAAS